MEQLYFETKEAAQRYGIPVRTLKLWREKRRGPDYYRVGNTVLYRDEDMERFMAAHKVSAGEKVGFSHADQD